MGAPPLPLNPPLPGSVTAKLASDRRTVKVSVYCSAYVELQALLLRCNIIVAYCQGSVDQSLSRRLVCRNPTRRFVDSFARWRAVHDAIAIS